MIPRSQLPAILILTWIVGCGPTSSRPSDPVQPTGIEVTTRPIEPPPLASDYVGSIVCAECHREIAEQYATHPMGRASGPILAVTPLEKYGDAAFFSSKDGKRYTIEKSDTEVVHHEILPGNALPPLYDQAVPMDLSIGSGRRGRSYGYRRGNRFFMSPIGWYTSKECWDLSPGYLPGIHQRFDRVLTERCLGCHIGRMHPGPVPDTWASSAPIVEHMIGCERCHGPGATHVEHYRHPDTFNGVDRLVNPARLDPIRRDAVCHQCHYQAGKTVPRYGKRSLDFRPGDRMTDVWVVLNSKLGERQAVTQSEQMLASTCYRSSSGRMGCISCHNPHGLPAGDPAVAFDKKCAACHAEGQSECSLAVQERADKTCVGCHMPRFDTSNIPHTALTDHRLLRSPSQASRSGAASKAVFDEGEPTLPDWETRRAEALLYRIDRTLVRGPRDLERAAKLLRELERQVPDDPEVWEARAWIASRLGKWADVETASRKALELAPKRIDSHELLLGALADRSAWQDVLDECELLLKLDPDKALYHTTLAEAAWHLGDVDRGLAAAERSLECNPTQMDLRRKLARAYGQLGNMERAQTHRRVLEESMKTPQSGR